MNTPRQPPRFVPTLTEVVEFEEAVVLDGGLMPGPAPLPDVAQPAAASASFAGQPLGVEAAALGPPLVSDFGAPAFEPAATMGQAAVFEPYRAETQPPLAPADHGGAMGQTAASEDVPAFLLATQPLPVWTQSADSSPVTSAPDQQAVVLPPEMLADVPTAVPTDEPAQVPSVPQAPSQPDDVSSAEREEQIVQNVLLELQRRADLMLEYRLRETLTPILARLCDTLIKEARQDLAATLRDVVARAVAQELTRHRPK